MGKKREKVKLTLKEDEIIAKQLEMLYKCITERRMPKTW